MQDDNFCRALKASSGDASKGPTKDEVSGHVDGGAATKPVRDGSVPVPDRAPDARDDAAQPDTSVEDDFGDDGKADAGPAKDAGATKDAGTAKDAGAAKDAGTLKDAGTAEDAGQTTGQGSCSGATPHGCFTPMAGNHPLCPAQSPEQSGFYPLQDEWNGCNGIMPDQPLAQDLKAQCSYEGPNKEVAKCICDTGQHWLCSCNAAGNSSGAGFSWPACM